MLRDHDLCGAVQQMRAAIVTEPAPELQHAIEWRSREGARARKFRNKPLVIGNDGRDLSLLQHDLGDPDAVGVARVLPRQIAAAMHSLPID